MGTTGKQKNKQADRLVTVIDAVIDGQDKVREPSREKVGEMFDRIAGRYDFLNRLLSFRRDVAWRDEMLKQAPTGKNLSLLDVACGTGDVLLAFLNEYPNISDAAGLDLAGKMLEVGHQKIEREGFSDKSLLIRGDAHKIPFKDGTFDLVTIAFGVRNFVDRDRGLSEMLRVLKPGGKLLILEFSLPGNWLVRKVYLAYFRYILPLLGGMISGDMTAYRYLNRTVETYPYGQAFADILIHTGFSDVEFKPLTFGVATLYVANKPSKTTPDILAINSSRLTLKRGSKTTSLPEGLQKAFDDMEQTVNLWSCEAGSKSGRFESVTVPIKAIDPLQFLAGPASQSRIGWIDRDDRQCLVGLGVADEIRGSDSGFYDTIFEKFSTGDSLDLRYYGGISFDAGEMSDSDSHWSGFGSWRFLLPRFVISCSEGECSLICNLHTTRDADNTESLLSELFSLFESSGQQTANIPELVKRSDSPKQYEWFRGVTRIIQEIDNDLIQKAVLARETLLEFNGQIDLSVLMSRLFQTTCDCYRFCFQFDGGPAFVGASPERLFRRRQNKIDLHALAGTRPRSPNIIKDQQLALDLTANGKDKHEHALVSHHITDTLDRLCESHDGLLENEPVVRKLARVQHLERVFHGVLRTGVTDADLLRNLHPTPAVGGSPRAEALALIATIEPFDRGWYAGPVGFISADEIELAVGIRSGLVENDTIRLYSGAGIVMGSDPSAEWTEIENKLASFKAALKIS